MIGQDSTRDATVWDLESTTVPEQPLTRWSVLSRDKSRHNPWGRSQRRLTHNLVIESQIGLYYRVVSNAASAAIPKGGGSAGALHGMTNALLALSVRPTVCLSVCDGLLWSVCRLVFWGGRRSYSKSNYRWYDDPIRRRQCLSLVPSITDSLWLPSRKRERRVEVERIRARQTHAERQREE